jgi:Zn-finger nucleic acid-binding protein/glutaredoxin
MKPTTCPSCRTAMAVHAFDSVSGGTVELDMCFACQGIWFDPHENLKLTPAALVELFRLLHEQRDARRQPLSAKLSCPHCTRTLAQGFDVVRSGRYITFRCPNRDGRFSTFSAFMIEKGFVRLLTSPEIEDLAKRVGVIHCGSCGAPVDLRRDQSCPHCRCAFSLLDPKAVEQALAGYARAAADTQNAKVPELADALVMLERDRLKAQREEQAQRGSLFTREVPDVDLWELGVSMVWKMLR